MPVKPPTCRLCKTAHWSHEKHNFGAAPAATKGKTNGEVSQRVPRRTEDRGEEARPDVATPAARPDQQDKRAAGKGAPRRPAAAKRDQVVKPAKAKAKKVTRKKASKPAAKALARKKVPASAPKKRVASSSRELTSIMAADAHRREIKRKQMERYRARRREREAAANGQQS